MSIPYSLSNLPKQIFINNEYVDSKSDKKLTVHNPADGSLIADDVPIAGEQDVDAAVSAAEKAFPAWKKTTPTERRNLLYKFAELLEKHSSEIYDLTSVALGAPASIRGWEGMCAEVCLYLRDTSTLPKIRTTLTHSKSYSATTLAGSTSSPASPGRRTTAFSRSCATNLSV